MKRFLLFLLVAVTFLSLYGKNPKYIFLFIGDGMATPQRMIAEEFSVKTGRGRLAINSLPYHGTTRTSSATHVITDSAAAATAIACGEKTGNGRIGVSADGKRKLESVAYVAKKKGKKVGIVTSVTINHATPAGFYANRPHRSKYYEIALDLIASGFDYFGGGVVQKPNDKKSSEYQGDIYQLAEKAGYKVVKEKVAFQMLRPGVGKVLARGNDSSLPYGIDNDRNVPTLAEFTAKGIELLDNPNGFFMMVEGGAIDWCGHANEAAGNLFEVLELDKAVKVALEFAKKNPDETLIVVTGDHETGGMTMGFAGSGSNMDFTRLGSQTVSIGTFKQKLNEAAKNNPEFSFEDAKKMLSENFGFVFSSSKARMGINSSELKYLKEGFEKGKLHDAARVVMSRKAGVGWSTGGHTALPVLTTSTGVKAEIFAGLYENTDIAKKIKSLL